MASTSTSDGRIRRRAVVVGIAAGVVLLFAFTAFVIRLAENAVRDEAEARVQSTAELSARLVGEQTTRLEEIVDAYGQRLRRVTPPRRARLTPADEAQADTILTEIESEVAGVDGALMTDERGRVVAAEPPGRVAIGTDLSGREWFRGLQRTHRSYLSRAYTSGAPGRPKVTVVAAPVRAPGGRTVGLLVVSERTRNQATADALVLELGARLTVLDQAGVIVARSGAPTQRLLSLRRDPLVRDALRRRSGVDTRDVAGERTVSGYAPARGGWAVVADVPAEQAFADVPRLRTALILASVVVAFLLLWLIPMLVTRLGRARDALGVSAAFQSDLLPAALPAGVRTTYVASERRMLLGGDFIDAGRSDDGAVALCIGDVCGHGPRSAALGATLRAAWRTLSFEPESPIARLALLDRVVDSERRDRNLFATLAGAVVAPGGDRLAYVLAGHPPPLLIQDGRIEILDGRRGPALGLDAADAGWPVVEHGLHGDWALVLYTDGLIEAAVGDGRLGLDGLERLVEHAVTTSGRLDSDALLRAVEALAADGSLEDDLAMIVVDGTALARDDQARLRTTAIG